MKQKSERKRKTRLHFNRVNMQRGKKEVWSAHNSKGCFQAEKIKVVKNGETVAETVYKPEAQQPRAYFTVFGKVTIDGNTVIVEV